MNKIAIRWYMIIVCSLNTIYGMDPVPSKIPNPGWFDRLIGDWTKQLDTILNEPQLSPVDAASPRLQSLLAYDLKHAVYNTDIDRVDTILQKCKKHAISISAETSQIIKLYIAIKLTPLMGKHLINKLEPTDTTYIETINDLIKKIDSQSA